MSFRSSTKENGHWRKRKNPFILLLVVDTFAHLFAAVLTAAAAAASPDGPE